MQAERIFRAVGYRRCCDVMCTQHYWHSASVKGFNLAQHCLAACFEKGMFRYFIQTDMLYVLRRSPA